MNLSSPLAGNYTSPPYVPGWWARTFPGAAFYPSMFAIVLRAARIARAGRYDDEQWIASSLEIARLIERTGGTIYIENPGALGSLPGPAVLVGNHMSTLETFLLPSVLRPYRPVTFVVKRELVEVPVFKHIMKTRDPIVVGRENPRDDLRIMLEEGEARLRAGMNVVVFPQRTRAPHFEPEQFNSVGVKLARRAGVPVVPLAVRTDFWSTGRLIRDFGAIHPERPVRISFGAPLPVTGSGRDVQAAVIAFIAAKMQAWGVPVIRSATPAPSADAPAGAAPPD